MAFISDVYCGFHAVTVDGQWRVTFGLDGLESSRAALIIDSAVSYFAHHCELGGVAALVADRTGAFEEIDWDAVVAGGQKVREIPDLLILLRSLVPPDLQSVSEEFAQCPRYLLLHSGIATSAQSR